MTEEEFVGTLDCLGSDLQKWPRALREQATLTLKQFPRTLDVYESQLAINQKLKDLTTDAPSCLKTKIMNKIQVEQPFNNLINWLLHSILRTTFSIIFPLAIGGAVGFFLEEEAPEYHAVDSNLYAQSLLGEGHEF